MEVGVGGLPRGDRSRLVPGQAGGTVGFQDSGGADGSNATRTASAIRAGGTGWAGPPPAAASPAARPGMRIARFVTMSAIRSAWLVNRVPGTPR